ncbi:hypothetical protein SAMN05216388_1003238 [Halorientalis persicus]|jgi:hypothetical protein|uniref:Uncharacterized protein n=1 Tax=Halorientalis persicus TaxID=1367881 RepID=A0A1H8GYK6_9EURY|nr:hypothetical protein [Halorientalis persicus]SEN49046.1 hypothetical protein SAMN05216388_1003238 [Halorientalis persicus]
MSRSVDQSADTEETVYEKYVLNVRVVEVTDGDDTRYRFEAPDHCGKTFEDPEMATLYADVYFDVNGFVESETGERGVPPKIIPAGRDTMVAYMRTLPGADEDWVSCYFAERPDKIKRLIRNVRARAEKVRAGVVEQDVADRHGSRQNVEG